MEIKKCCITSTLFSGKSEETAWPRTHGACEGGGAHTPRERLSFFVVCLLGSVFPIQNCSDVKCSLAALQVREPMVSPGLSLPPAALCCGQICQLFVPLNCFSCLMLGSRCLVPHLGVAEPEGRYALSFVLIQGDSLLGCDLLCKAPFELGLLLGLQNCRLGCIQHLAVCSLLKAVFGFHGF